jgi:hypothetical protein
VHVAERVRREPVVRDRGPGPWGGGVGEYRRVIVVIIKDVASSNQEHRTQNQRNREQFVTEQLFSHSAPLSYLVPEVWGREIFLSRKSIIQAASLDGNSIDGLDGQIDLADAIH